MPDYSKRIVIESKQSFARQVIAIQNTPPSSPNKGDRYIVGTNPTGTWTGKAKQIAWYDGSAWQFDLPSEGWFTWVLNEHKLYHYTADGNWDEYAEGVGDMLKSVYDTDDDGIVDKAEKVDDGTYSATALEITQAISKSHTQNTDTYLDLGGPNEITASQVKEAYNTRAKYDADLGVIYFENL